MEGSAEWHTRSVGDMPTDVVRFAPARLAGTSVQEQQPALIFITGNPGAIDFFEPFLRNIWELSGRRIEVCGISHAGHSERTATDQLFGLEDQITHKVAFLREYAGQPVFVVGHSIGCYIALRAIERLEAAGQVKLLLYIGLCPTISRFTNAFNYKFISPILRFRALHAAAVGLGELVSALPRPVVRAIASLGLRVMTLSGHTDAEARSGTINSLESLLGGSRIFRNILHLTKDEAATLKDVAPLAPVLDSLGPRAIFVYTATDGWVAPRAGVELAARFKACSYLVEWEPHMAHMFSLHSHASGRMASVVWDHVRAALLEAAQETGPAGSRI